MGGYFPDYSIYLTKMEYADKAYYIKNCSPAGCRGNFHPMSRLLAPRNPA